MADPRSDFQYNVFVWGLEEKLAEQRMTHLALFGELEKLRHAGQTSVSDELKKEILESASLTIAIRGALRETHEAMQSAERNGTTFEVEFSKLADIEMQELTKLVKQQRKED